MGQIPVFDRERPLHHENISKTTVTHSQAEKRSATIWQVMSQHSHGASNRNRAGDRLRLWRPFPASQWQVGQQLLLSRGRRPPG